MSTLINEIIEELKKYDCDVVSNDSRYIKLWCANVLEIPKELEEKLKKVNAIVDARCAGSCSGFGDLKRYEQEDKVIYVAEAMFYPDEFWITIEIPKNKE
jgi:hypothetical protein